jgi:hypothetical protein
MDPVGAEERKKTRERFVAMRSEDESDERGKREEGWKGCVE